MLSLARGYGDGGLRLQANVGKGERDRRPNQDGVYISLLFIALTIIEKTYKQPSLQYIIL